MQTYNSRNDVPNNEKWNLDDIYPSIEKWTEDYKEIENQIPILKEFDGNIIDGESLFEFLNKQEELHFILNKVYVYAMLLGDIDTRNTDAQALISKARDLSKKLGIATSFFAPFLLELDEEKLREFINQKVELQYFEDELLEEFRYKSHVLSKTEEKLLSNISGLFSSGSQTYGMLNNADMKFGLVTNKDGEKIELTRGMYSQLVEHEDREIRKEAYKAYYEPYLQLKNSFASTLASTIKTNTTLSQVRNFPSALEKGLFGNKIPKDVYDNLIETTKENLSVLHRYNQIRKEQLGLDELRQYDLSVPLTQDAKQIISYEKAYDTMLEALSPLGEEYISTLKAFKDKRYIDVRETPGKRSGAYNLGLYGVHPFVLLNHTDDLDGVFTLVHEMGHAMHSHYSSKHQPMITAGYSIFVAEVASTVNEILLIKHLLSKTTDVNVRKHLFNHYIDQFKGTFFTQVMFAEFEKKTHELSEQEEPLNVEVFNNLFEELVKTYNGPELVLDEEAKYGWSRIPHFYRPFYVYQYATGFATAIWIAERILSGDIKTLHLYLELLKSGSSDYPLELLKKVGVDLTTPKPIENAMSLFGTLVDKFSKL